MTYILGWKNYSSVFLAGDSVITIEHPKSCGNNNTFRNESTFGELHIYEDEKTVSEKWLKLYDLNNKVILAISGIVEEAYEGIKFFRMYLETEIDIQIALENSFRDRDVGILAGYMEGDVPRLISYNCKSGLQEHGFFKVAHSGSIGSSFMDQTEEFFSEINGKDWSEDQILTSIIAVAQSFCFQENIIDNGVGGFFSGIRIDKNGVNWQRDLAFIPFSYNGKELQTNQLAEILGEAKIVMTQVRESVLYSFSPFIEDVKKARRPFSNFQPEEIINSNDWFNERIQWVAKWGNQINSNCDEYLADYYIFYNTRKPIVAMVYSYKTKPFELIEDDLYFKDMENVMSLLIPLFSQADKELTLYIDF